MSRTNSARPSDSATPGPSPCPPPGLGATSTPPDPTSLCNSPTTAPSLSHRYSASPQPMQVREIPISAIDPPPHCTHPRDIDPAHVDRLAKSIAHLGLLQPIAITPNGLRYTLVAGQHRLAAVQQLHWLTITAHVLNLSDILANAAALADNVTRSALSPVQEALALAPLVEQHPNGTEGVAADTGRSRAWVEDRLEILTWPDSLIAALDARKIPLAAAKILARIADPQTRETRVRDAILNGINARTASLWLQASKTLQQDHSNMSETSVPGARPLTETHTTVRCFVCREMIDLTRVTSTNVCHRCLTELANPPPPDGRQPHTPEGTVTTHTV